MPKQTIAFMDLETTGTDPARHEIIEVGCIIARLHPREGAGPAVEKIEEFDIKVKPRNIETADQRALRINRYNEADWLFAAEPEAALAEIAHKTDGAIMAAQNVSFDAAFLEAAFIRYGIKNKMHYRKLDVPSMAFALLFNTGEDIASLTLRDLCARYGVTNEKAHTALSDTRATFEIFRKIVGA